MSHLKLGLNEDITLETPIAGTVQKTPIALDSYIKSVGDLGFFDTGLMPRPDTGLISYRRAAGWESFVFQVEAGEHMLIWGRSERDPTAAKLKVAMPYRIIMGDHKFHGDKWHLIGARHFYSYKPIKSWSDPIFNCNVPNLNCKGYSGTGVGWICLYHTGNYAGMNLMKRCLETSMRTSGGEAYNDANMSSTDGARYYKAAKKPQHFWDPSSWAAKTKKDGWRWVVDESSDLLIPVMLSNPAVTPMSKNVPSGKPASLFDLTRGLYSAYYNDQMYLKPHNLMDPENPFVGHYKTSEKQKTFTYINEYANSLITTIKSVTSPGWAPKIEKIKCEYSSSVFPETDPWNFYVDAKGVIRTIHPSVMNKNKGKFITLKVDLAKISLSPATKKLQEQLMPILGNLDVPTSKSKIAYFICDSAGMTTEIINGIKYQYHPSCPIVGCGMCKKAFSGPTSGAPSKNGERCAGCINKVKCPSCDRVTPEKNLITIDRFMSDIVGMEQFKERLVLSLKDGKDLLESEPITISAPKMTKVACCKICANTMTQCLCGKLISLNQVKGLHKGEHGRYVTECPSCSSNDDSKPMTSQGLSMPQTYKIQYTPTWSSTTNSSTDLF